MVNYKGLTRSITFSGIKIHYPAQTGHVVLYDQTALSTTADAFLNTTTGTAYTVTAGKQIHVVGVQVWMDTTTASGTVVISQGDTEDAETVTKWTVRLPTKTNAYMEQMCNFTVAAGKFITLNPSAASVSHIVLVGYELDV